MRFVFITVVLVLAGCKTTANVDQSHQTYMSLWQSRLDGYRGQFIERHKLVRERIGERWSGFREEPKWATYISASSDSATDIRGLYQVVGRAETLKRFLAHMKDQPSAGLTDVWFQTEVENIRHAAGEVDRRSAKFLGNLSETIEVSKAWLSQLEGIAKAQGLVKGTATELISLYKNAKSYFSDRVAAQKADYRAAEQRRRAGVALMALGAYMNQLQYQQQMLNAMNRPRTCTRMGATVTCY